MAELRQALVESKVIRDSGISTLDAVFDPVTMGEHLRLALPGEWGEISTIRFQILKHHPGKRCTLEIALRTTMGWGYLIGKVYAADRLDVYRAMNEIRRAGFGPGEEFSIPQPLAYVPALRLLLQERVEGPRAKEAFLTGNELDRAEASTRSARWLAKFHAVGPRLGPVLDLSARMSSIERWARTVAKLGEPFAGQAKRLFKGLEETASPNGTEMCAGHGSYNCNQIILTENSTVTLDWDSYDLADPSRDVARFIVALQRLGLKYLGSIRALDAAAELFLQAYTALSPSGATTNLSWYRASICLRLAKYEANRPVSTFREGIVALLGEGLRVLKH